MSNNSIYVVLSISIHTFLVEGDDVQYQITELTKISIHTFLTEGDVVSVRCAGAMVISIHTFLAEGDIKIKEWAIGTDISIHTFLAEGDDIQLFGSREADVFQSTPSSRKVTFYNSKEWHTLQFQSTPSSRKVTCCTTNATVD